MAPILIFLPDYHETEILQAYAAGVDEVVIKPISPAVFLAKIIAWMRRSWTVPTAELSQVKAGKHRLEPTRRCLVNPEGLEINLTNLEFRLLHLLMSRPGYVFSAGDYPGDLGWLWQWRPGAAQECCLSFEQEDRRRSKPSFSCKLGRAAILFKGKAGVIGIIAVMSYVTYCDGL